MWEQTFICSDGISYDSSYNTPYRGTLEHLRPNKKTNPTPTQRPSSQPTSQPSGQPTDQPSSKPTVSAYSNGELEILSLTSSSPVIVSGSAVSSHKGGIAISGNFVLITGSSTKKYSLSLSSSSSVSTTFDSLVSNLATREAYTLAGASKKTLSYIASGSQVVSYLRLINSTTGNLTSTHVKLSINITLPYQSYVFWIQCYLSRSQKHFYFECLLCEPEDGRSYNCRKGVLPHSNCS